MVTWNEETKEKASVILKQLKGISIAEARDLLNWCGDYLLEQITVDFTRNKAYLKEHAENKDVPDIEASELLVFQRRQLSCQSLDACDCFV